MSVSPLGFAQPSSEPEKSATDRLGPLRLARAVARRSPRARVGARSIRKHSGLFEQSRETLGPALLALRIVE